MKTSRPTAGGIVVNGEGKMVLVEQHGNSWSFPKGGIDEGETELQAAKREVFEETGLKDIAEVGELGSYERYSLSADGKTDDLVGGLRKRTLFLFKTNTPADALVLQEDEVTKAGFYTIDEALELLTHPKDRAFLSSVREKIEAHM
jgi:8-oxo-dGTP pyrophosphatase MutT (NUDIX family)